MEKDHRTAESDIRMTEKPACPVMKVSAAPESQTNANGDGAGKMSVPAGLRRIALLRIVSNHEHNLQCALSLYGKLGALHHGRGYSQSEGAPEFQGL